MLRRLPRRSTPAIELRALVRLCAPGVFGMLALLLVWVGHAPAASASSNGNITTDPSSGPVGTPVAVEIRLSLDPSQPYTLTATSTDPTQGGCSSSQAIPGVGTVTVGSQGGFVNFTWPSAFGSGQYWLCASPQSGSGPTAHSLQPYTVTSGAAPTATPVGIRQLPTSAVSVDVPSDGAAAGSTVTVIVTAWMTPDNEPPATVKLVPYTNADVTIPTTFVVVANPAPGDFNLSVNLPASIPPGQYAFDIEGAYQVQTAFVAVIAPVTPTATGSPLGTRGHDTTSGSGGIPPIAIGAAVAALLVLAGAILVAAARGRKRAAEAEAARRRRDRGDDYAARHLADGYGMRHQREEMRRR